MKRQITCDIDNLIRASRELDRLGLRLYFWFLSFDSDIVLYDRIQAMEDLDFNEFMLEGAERELRLAGFIEPQESPHLYAPTWYYFYKN